MSAGEAYNISELLCAAELHANGAAQILTASQNLRDPIYTRAKLDAMGRLAAAREMARRAVTDADRLLANLTPLASESHLDAVARGEATMPPARRRRGAK